MDVNEFAQKVFEKLSEIEKDMKSIKNDVTSLKDDVSSLKDDVSSLKDDVSSLKEGQAQILKAIDELKADVNYAVQSSDENRKELYKIKQKMYS